jgi:hypothetical protein
MIPGLHPWLFKFKPAGLGGITSTWSSQLPHSLAIQSVAIRNDCILFALIRVAIRVSDSGPLGFNGIAQTQVVRAVASIIDLLAVFMSIRVFSSACSGLSAYYCHAHSFTYPRPFLSVLLNSCPFVSIRGLFACVFAPISV